MDYTVKLAYQSNYWYNDGLAKAQVRDMSGAITSLKKSLQYNRANLAARNLLGLVYYGRGDVIEALVEWILSKNFQPKDNIASYFSNRLKLFLNYRCHCFFWCRRIFCCHCCQYFRSGRRAPAVPGWLHRCPARFQ